MSLKVQWISILRERRLGDGAGGKTVVLFSLRQRYRVTVNRRRSARYDLRLEQSAHNLQGPGVETATRRVVCFRRPFPQLLHDDRLVTEDGTTYTVHTLRQYDWSLQVDCEVVR